VIFFTNNDKELSLKCHRKLTFRLRILNNIPFHRIFQANSPLNNNFDFSLNTKGELDEYTIIIVLIFRLVEAVLTEKGFIVYFMV